MMKSLVPGCFYWARSASHTSGQTTIVQVSTVFGEDRDFWTLAVLGSDQHHMIGDFEIISIVEPLDSLQMNQAAE
ncbi:hypothetical protein ACIQUB_17735 [Rhizobium sp. NPDC090275]|uniref:hypothetical protein n=1 Tax=Rhizobium sp. NPDC090275 TaxID=3364498 RepID=UPI00383A7BA8